MKIHLLMFERSGGKSNILSAFSTNEKAIIGLDVAARNYAMLNGLEDKLKFNAKDRSNASIVTFDETVWWHILPMDVL